MMVPSRRAGMLGLWELLLVTACVSTGVMESQLQQQGLALAGGSLGIRWCTLTAWVTATSWL